MSDRTYREPLSEEQIERAVERKFDQLDGRLLRGEIDQEEYEIMADRISSWSVDRYAEARKRARRGRARSSRA